MAAVVRWLLSLPFGIISLSSASAASFDCAIAISPRDRLICQTPTLSALDTQLGLIYQQKQAMLSPHGAELLQRSERSWLRYLATVCPLTPATSDDVRTVPATCLEMRYNERLTQLAQVAQKLGPFVFNRIDRFAAEPHDASDHSGSVPGFYVQHIAYPQIDNAASPAVAKWNKAYDKGDVDKSADCLDGVGDTVTDYEVGYANQKMTSVRWLSEQYCHGISHGLHFFRTENFVLSQNIRILVPSDVFAKGWETKLPQLLWKTVLAKGRKREDNQGDGAEAEIKADVIKSDQWLFTQDGLSVTFSDYEIGCYACNPGMITVPWDDVKPLLAPGSVVP